ncbi:choice-of-anchor U domain-containing protein [Thermus sediminis]|uniref:choice-of-anchor U domain-containing protein n=1 Tax=Thermus sediminis TaxID=1761908 RepID=UPI0018E527A3|nr:choice-of-anchor U domain-containing protein [Thermus sediminis]
MRIGAWYGFLTGLALLLAACSGGAPPPDLTLAGVSPNNPTVAQGSSLPLTLTFTSQNGFQGQVSLSVTENGQAPPWLTFSPTSASLNVPRGGQAQVTLQVQVARNAPTGPHSLSLRATYGERSAERSLTLNVTPPPDFAIALNPDSLTVQQGSSGTVQLTLTPQNGFTGTVNLSLVAGQDPVPQGLSLSPTSLTVSGSNPLTRDLTLTAGATTPTGIYRLKVRATGGNVTKDAELTVTVSASSGGGGGSNSGTVNTPGGQVGMGLQGGTFTQGPTYQSVTPPEGFQAPYGAIAFTAQVPQGGTLTVTLTFPQAIPQGAVLRKFVNNGWREVPGAQFSGNTATYQVRDGGDLDADGQANGQIVDPVALLTPSPGFTLSLNPDSLTIQQGGSGTTQLTLTPQGGFTGPVNLSLVDGNGNPVSGISLSPTTVSVSDPNNPVILALNVNVDSSVAAGNYSLQVRATSGNLTKTAGLSLTVEPLPPMSLSPVDPEVTLQGTGYYQHLSGTVTLTLTLTPSSGFNGYVDLSVLNANGQAIKGISIRLTDGPLYYSPSDGVRQYSVTLNVFADYDYYYASQPFRFWDLGPNALRLEARQGSTVHTADFTLTVRADPPGILWHINGPIILAVDAQGNVYGAILVSAGFVGQGYCHVVAFRPNGERFVFIQWDLNCNPDRDSAEGIGVDGDGNIYAAFTFSNSLLRLRKYTPQGEMLWERTIGGLEGFAKPESLVVTPEGRVYVAVTQYGPEEDCVYSRCNPVGVSVYAYDSQGNPLWSRRFQAYLQTPEENPRTYPVLTEHHGGLAVGPDGHIYVAGTAMGNLFRTLYGRAWNTDGLPTSAWVAKLNPADGSVVWGDQFVGDPSSAPVAFNANTVIPLTLAITPDGQEVYLGGTTNRDHPPYTHQGYNDGLLVRYSAATGQRLEVRLYGSPGYDDIKSIAFSPDGNYMYLELGGQVGALYKLSRTNLDLDSALWVMRLSYPRGGPYIILPHGNLLYVGNVGGESGPTGILRIIP